MRLCAGDLRAILQCEDILQDGLGCALQADVVGDLDHRVALSLREDAGPTCSGISGISGISVMSGISGISVMSGISVIAVMTGITVITMVRVRSVMSALSGIIALCTKLKALLVT